MVIMGIILVAYAFIILLSLIQIIRGKAKGNTKFKVFVAIEIIIFIVILDAFIKALH